MLEFAVGGKSGGEGVRAQGLQNDLISRFAPPSQNLLLLHLLKPDLEQF